LKKNNRLMQIMAAVAACLVLAASGYAQQLEKGKIETTGHVGLAMGVGTRAAFAGTLGTAINDRVFVLGELGWIPLGGTSASGQTGGSSFEFDSGGKILTFMAGAQYQFNAQRSFVPYAGAGLGLVHSSGETRTTIGGSTQTINVSSNNFYMSIGGGARYYVKDRWGFKPELMVFAGEDSFVRLGVGMFYQFGQ
jgi:opacity protein-like surface antigen